MLGNRSSSDNGFASGIVCGVKGIGQDHLPDGARDGQPLGHEFYERPALECVTDFLGKVLVHDTPAGRLAGVVTDVEAYPAFIDEVHHGNKRTPRSAVMWGPAGKAYVYLVYGVWHQFAAVVNDANVPDVVFVRGVIPITGTDQMRKRWDKPRQDKDLANTPGKLCRSFGITGEHYGIDLCGSELFLEDWAHPVPDRLIRKSKRVGINSRRAGHDAPLRYYLRYADAAALIQR